jgi:hypothetical protein
VIGVSLSVCSPTNLEQHALPTLESQVPARMDQQDSARRHPAASTEAAPSAAVARHGWAGALGAFVETNPWQVLAGLEHFVPDAGPPQVKAWRDSIRTIRACVPVLLAAEPQAAYWSLVLEYEMPLEARRADAVLLIGAAVVVLEFKGKAGHSHADIDQTHAYARDLRCYHDACHEQPVVPVLVPIQGIRHKTESRGIFVRGPAILPALLLEQVRATGSAVTLARFLSADAYRPLPTLVEAARELFRTGDLRRVHRAAAVTDGAVSAIAEVARDAAVTGTRRLVLLTGVPGAGKTLVGLRVVHAHMLDDLAAPSEGRKPAAPAVFLSGNGPLVEVLQYELKGAGGGGKAFVRGVKDYVKQYDSRRAAAPPEHVLVFDEAQRAYDAAMVAEKHKLPVGDPGAKSEPEHFVEFACRVPGWCVIVGLIGGGQEINRGEEAGLGQWADAIRHSRSAGNWIIHGPAHVAEAFGSLAFQQDAVLSLDQSLRSHLASELHRFVADLLRRKAGSAADLAAIAARLAEQGHDLLVTRDLDVAKAYLRDRYADDSEARFGILASSRDKALEAFGVDNRGQKPPGFHGPWYGDPEGSSSGRSSRDLSACETEFGAQGLELDAVLLAWGTDFLVDERGSWSNALMKPHRSPRVPIADPWQLRANAYRVLLTRSRDATVVFVPAIPELDATFRRLSDVGFRRLSSWDGDR